MARIVVVSRNPTLAWGLSAEGRELAEVRPHQLDDWLANARPDDPVDLIVLDLDDPGRSLAVITELRARAQMAPALLVSGDAAGWDAVAEQQLPAAEVLPLPVTTAGLQLAVARLLEGAALPPPGHEAEPDQEEPAREEPAREEPAREEPAREEPIPGLRRSPKTSKAVLEARANRPKVEPSPPVQPPLIPPQQVPPATEPAVSLAPPAAPAPPLVREVPESIAPASRGLDNANALARALTLRVDELYSVAETADVIVMDVVERVRSDSAALMVPDGGRWRVAAGSGLGAIERRFELPEDSWVVTHIARGSRGVIIEDTDVARQPFQNAPLASRRHLLAAPIPLVEGIVLVARDADPPFTEDELVVLAGLAQEAGLLLAAALDVRELARRLLPLADIGD